MKPFKNLDEQIVILKSRGMIIDDEELSKDYLLKYNYYNVVNCYSRFLQVKKDVYNPKATFNEIRAIHHFDTEIKNILLKNIIIIETHFKSIVSYYFCKNFSNDIYPYLNPSNYNPTKLKEVTDLITDLNKLINVERNKGNNAISHYYNHHGDVPLWVLSNFMTFGQIVRLYNCCNNTIRHEIAKSINRIINNNLSSSSVRLSPRCISNIMDNIKNVRNVLAHDNKLFDYMSRYSYPYIQEIHRPLNITPKETKQTIYHTIVVMRMFLNESQYNTMKNSLNDRSKTLAKKLHSISNSDILQSIGYPQEYL